MKEGKYNLRSCSSGFLKSIIEIIVVIFLQCSFLRHWTTTKRQQIRNYMNTVAEKETKKHHNMMNNVLLATVQNCVIMHVVFFCAVSCFFRSFSIILLRFIIYCFSSCRRTWKGDDDQVDSGISQKGTERKLAFKTFYNPQPLASTNPLQTLLKSNRTCDDCLKWREVIVCGHLDSKQIRVVFISSSPFSYICFPIVNYWKHNPTSYRARAGRIIDIWARAITANSRERTNKHLQDI